MKFLVCRSSGYFFRNEPKPCDEAIEGPPQPFFPEGFKKGWVVEMDGLQSLISFCEKYGKLIIKPSECENYTLEIEIYDSWRE